MTSVISLLACTVCDSETGTQVRAAIFDETFLVTLASVAAPFPILVLGLAVYHFAPAARRRIAGDRRSTGDLHS
jgi:hypothetical protein